MKTKQLLLVPLLLFLNWGYGLAQTTYMTASNNLPEPNSAEGTFSANNYSVDLFTGIANVSIPIYSYNVDGLNLGVGLSYNTKGITVDQIASEIGLGWDLSAGGYIMRYVNGMEDEYQSTFNYSDPEGDDLIAVFGGRVEKLLYSPNSPMPSYPKSEISMTSGSPVTINGRTYGTWKITDEKGNVFEFNKVNYLWKVFNGTVYYPAYQWLLTKITTYSGQVVTYTYSDYELNYADYRDQQAMEIRNPGSPVSWQLYNIIDTAHIWHGTESHLTEIDYPNGDKVNFSMAAASAKRCDLYNNYYLDSITVSSGYDSHVENSETFRFNYAYFSSYPDPVETPFSTTCSAAMNDLRLKLKSIDKAGNDHGIAEPYYTFEYNATQLPKRMTQSQDWFGYFNGKTNYGITFKSQSYNLGTPAHFYTDALMTYTYPIGNDHSSDITYMQANVLTKATSSMGAEMDLYYKAHTLSDAPPSSDVYPIPSDFEATGSYDGLCIDHIDYKDGFNSGYASTSFSFSNGLRFYKGGYFWYTVYYAQNPVAHPAALPNQRIYTNHFITPYDMFNNSNHGYSNASVSISSPVSSLGVTRYQFTNIVNETTGRSRLVDDKTASYKIAFPRDSMQQSEMGLLMKKEQYDNAGNLVKLDTFQYEKNNLITNYSYLNTRTVLDTFWDTATVTYDSVITSRPYTRFDMSMMRLKYRTSKTFSGGKSFATTYQYDYDQVDNLTDIKWIDSRGVNYNKQYLYNYNFVLDFPPYGTYLPGIQHLMASLLYEHTTGADSLISSQFSHGILNSLGYVFPKKYASTLKKPSSYDFGTDYVIRGTYDLTDTLVAVTSENTQYDDHNNPLETKYLNQNIFSSAIWDTRIGQKLSNVSNAKYSDIAYTSFEGSFKPAGVSDYNKGNWNFDPTYISYVPYGSSIMPVTGRYYYELSTATSTFVTSKNLLDPGKQYILSFWAINQPAVMVGSSSIALQQQATKGSWKLYTCTFTGGSGVTLECTGVPSGSTLLDDVRLCPIDASMTSYTYEPLFGVSSECDERNNIIYHDYDAFGREKVARDINGNIITLSRHVIHGSDN